MGQITLPEGAAPAAPSAGYVALYVKTDQRYYYKTPAGVEYALTSGAGVEALSNKTITASTVDSTPIGQSVAAAGSFTTLSASENVTIKKSGGFIEFRQADNSRTGYIQEAGGNVAIVGERAGSKVQTYANNTQITEVSSAGLAVTGGLSATENITIPDGGAGKLIGLASDGQYMRIHASPTANKGGGIILFGESSGAPNVVRLMAGATMIAETSPTGLSVTGNLSASGNLSVLGGYANFNGTGYIRADGPPGVMRFQHGGGGYSFRNADNVADLFTITADGNVGIGVTPSDWVSFPAVEFGGCNSIYSNYAQMSLGSNAYNNGSWRYKTSAPAGLFANIQGVFEFFSAPAGTAGQPINFTQDMTLANGNLLVGVTSGVQHQFTKGSTQGTSHAFIGTAYGTNFYEGGAYGESTAATVQAVHKNSSTLRSINAAGTINATGNDYAEYENNNGLPIAKGSVVGFKFDGTLTLIFADAIRFGIKSTNPSYVGGDTWGGEDQVGKRPEKPCYVAPTYEGSPNPGEKPVEPVLSLPPAPIQQDGETDETCAIRTAQWQEYCATATTVHQASLAAYAEALAEWGAANAAWQADDAIYQGKVIAMQSSHEYAMARYEEALTDFEVRLEAARQQVDRVAYSGKVPVNVMGATPGGYIVPVEGADGQIAGEFVADPDFAQYKRAVGRVNRILEDGRAEVAVMVH